MSQTFKGESAMSKYRDVALTEAEVLKIRAMQAESKEAVDNTNTIRELQLHSRLQADLTQLRHDIAAFRKHPVSCPCPDPTTYVTLEKLIPSNPDPRHVWKKLVSGELDLNMLELMITKYCEIEKGEKDHVYMNGLIGTILAKEFITPVIEPRIGQSNLSSEKVPAINVPNSFVTIPDGSNKTPVANPQSNIETVVLKPEEVGLSAYERWKNTSCKNNSCIKQSVNNVKK